MFSPRLDLANNQINHVIYVMSTACGIKLMRFHISPVLQPHGKAVKSRKDLDVRAPPAKVGTRLANVARRGRSLAPRRRRDNTQKLWIFQGSPEYFTCERSCK